ncbi:hypothetical protein BKA93DRAFT_878999 [Sparassis latifolia]
MLDKGSYLLENPTIDKDAEPWMDTPFVARYIVAERALERPMQQDMVNHWRLWFALGPNNCLVMDMVKTSVQDKSAFIGVVLKLSKRRMTEIKALPRRNDVTVRKVLDFLIRNGRLRYRFTEMGTGCAWWVAKAVADLEEHGFIRKPDGAVYTHDTMADTVLEAVKYLYEEKEDGGIQVTPFALEPRCSIFY